MIIHSSSIRILLVAIISTLCDFSVSKYLNDYETKLSTWVKNITASSTCGYGPDPEEFCLWTRSGRLGFACTKCDSRDVRFAHSITHVLEDSDRWWKSENGQSKVIIDVDLGQEFFVTGIILKMGPTPRPSEWVLERSVDSGKTFTPWQYFESDPQKCQTAHSIRYNISLTRSDQVLCKAALPSNIENEEVVVNLLENRPGWKQFGTSELLQNWTKATNIRFRFIDWGTHFGHLMYKDRSVDKTRFYTLQGISIFGRCVCYGHDRGCEHDSETSRMVCKCQHNTCGPQCNICCPGFNQHMWQPSRQCEACNCRGHASDCYYNKTVEKLKLSKNMDGSYVGGGVCINCKDHTAGINCEYCENGFYRPAQKPATDPDACEECKCDSSGSIRTICHQIGGQCQCRGLIGGRACDRCIPEYWGFPNCKPCKCASTGSFRIGTCNETTGQCFCKKGTVGLYCDQCASVDRHLMTADGCLECDPCSLIQYRNTNELLRTSNRSLLDLRMDLPSKSWVDVRLQWNKGSLQNLRNVWNEVYDSDLNANRRIKPRLAKLVKAPLLLDLQTSIDKHLKDFTNLVENAASLLYSIEAIKLVDGSLAAKTRHLGQIIHRSYESCQGAVEKLRTIASGQAHSHAVDDYINQAKLLHKSINENDLGRISKNCYQERTLARNLHRKAVILNGHFLQFQRLRKHLDYLQTIIADIDKRIWDANSNLNSINSLRRTSEILFEVKQKINAIFKENERLEALSEILIELKKLRKSYKAIIEFNYLSIPRLEENKLKLKERVSKYQESLQQCENYKPAFEAQLLKLHGNVTEINGVYKHAIEKPQVVLSNLADQAKLVYSSGKVAGELQDTLNRVSDILEQFKNKFLEWFPVQKLETTTATAAAFEVITKIIDGESSGYFYNDDEEDDDDWDRSLLADEVFFESDNNVRPSLQKTADVKLRSNLTSLRTKLQDYVDKFQESESAVQRSGKTLESSLSTLERLGHSTTTSEALKLVQENKKLSLKTSKLLDNVTLVDELGRKYGGVYLDINRTKISVKNNVQKAFSTLKNLADLEKPSIVPQKLKYDNFAKLAASLREKIAQAKVKASKIRAPLRLISPGFVKLALPVALAPPYSYLTTFDIWFNSASGNGFIFRIGNSSETWGASIFLCLRKFRLEMHIHQNKHTWKGSHPTYVQSNRWYRLEMEWVCSQLKITLTAVRGKSHVQEVQLPWTCDLERAFVPGVWLGGLDEEMETSITGSGLPNMDGCIGELNFNEGTLNLFAWEASRGVQTSCTSSEKDKHHKVTSMSIRSDIIQVHSSEDEIFPPLVEFSFRSTQRNATIVHIMDAKKEDWMEVKLAEGQVLVEFGHGPKSKLSLPSQVPYNDGQLHYVNVNVTGKEILKQVLVSVNGLDRHSGALFISRDKPSTIHIGGIPNQHRKQHGQTSPSFVGCLVGLKVNNKTLAISNHSEYLEFSLETCPVKMGMCMCLSRTSGVIRVVRLGYIIDFLGLTFQINNLDHGTQGTVLYYTPSPKNYLEIFVLDHGVWVAWKVGSEFQRVKLTDVDNGTWHSVLLQNRYQHKNSSVLQLDEESVDLPLTLFLGVKYTAQHKVYLGGTALGKTKFQHICFKNFLLNDEVKDFSDITIPNGLTNCPLIYA